jgi:hypothetical protein
MTRNGLADIEHAPDIGTHQRLPISMVELFEGTPALNACVVHQNVDCNSASFDGVNAVLYRLRICYVESGDSDCRTGRAQLIGSLLKAIHVAAVEYQVGASLRKSFRNCGADAPATTGYERGPPSQIEKR